MLLVLPYGLLERLVNHVVRLRKPISRRSSQSQRDHVLQRIFWLTMFGRERNSAYFLVHLCGVLMLRAGTADEVTSQESICGLNCKVSPDSNVARCTLPEGPSVNGLLGVALNIEKHLLAVSGSKS